MELPSSMKERLASRLPHDGNSEEVVADCATAPGTTTCENLPQGVILRSLQTHHDERGALSELFRASWDTQVEPLQWNFAESEARVLRGVHIHANHADYLILLRGHATIGLRDLRPDSPTRGMSALVEMRDDELHALTIPPGVAHGFYFHEPSAHIYAVSEYWDPRDELGCHWADPALEIAWPDAEPLISGRDAALPSLRELVESFPRAQSS
jgi:dTDP-4-dehydrorhamnose 3,5-epimerase